MKMPGRPGSVGLVEVEFKRYGTQLVKWDLLLKIQWTKSLLWHFFLSLFYVNNCCTASVVADPLIHDLELWNQFESMKTQKQVL